MNQRTRIIPIAPMARRLAAYAPAERATPEAARAILLDECYLDDDIDLGLDAAMRLAVHFAKAGASDHPVARAIALARDAAAVVAILIGGSYWWAYLA